MKWIDIEDIAENLESKYPDIDILRVRFTDLSNYVQSIEGFNDDPVRCNEKILEAIQSAWLEIRDE